MTRELRRSWEAGRLRGRRVGRAVEILVGDGHVTRLGKVVTAGLYWVLRSPEISGHLPYHRLLAGLWTEGEDETCFDR